MKDVFVLLNMINSENVAKLCLNIINLQCFSPETIKIFVYYLISVILVQRDSFK